MVWPYQYTPYVWPMLASAAFLGALGIYAWRHRTTPGATPFGLLMLFVVLWALGAAAEAASADFPTRVFWYKVQAVMKLPTAICSLYFAVDYAGLNAWLGRRNQALLAAPLVGAALAMVPISFVDGLDSLMVDGYVWQGMIRGELRPLGLAVSMLGMVLMLLATVVFLALFVRSPLHRRPVALILVGHVAPRLVYPLEAVYGVVALPFDVTLLAFDFTCLMYAIALFRFRLFDVVPVARASVIERMADAMVVLDAGNRVADLNAAAQQLLGGRRSRMLGRDAALALAAAPGLAELARGPDSAEAEVSIDEGPAQRFYQVSSSPLVDRHGFRLGRLLVLHDITQLKQAREQLLRQERALAALRERERLARELHDGLGQVLGYVSLQADAARKLLDDGKTAVAAAQLGRLAGVARDAHADIREFILALRAAPAEQRAFFPALSRYLEGFAQNYGIRVELSPAEGLGEAALGPEGQAQLFRIVQEALSNARKHGGARAVQVAFATQDNLARVVIQDDGEGFDPGTADSGLGLRFMRERAAELGGRVEIQSAAGAGTRVVVELPLEQPREV